MIYVFRSQISPKKPHAAAANQTAGVPEIPPAHDEWKKKP